MKLWRLWKAYKEYHYHKEMRDAKYNLYIQDIKWMSVDFIESTRKEIAYHNIKMSEAFGEWLK
ncbi:hypothetical protein [Bacillus cereus]|uniref:hypothetical protein n=1 Tax=Bacillus cereus TaxID=1396 RepID=UPI000BFB11B4|nr:hypothetical protein [Bacillus cereus]PFD41450.1 hypothetical protein CN281_27090 [Bacillus cereus]